MKLIKHTHGKAFTPSLREKNSYIHSSSKQNIFYINTSKAKSINAYAEFGSRSPCLLDAFLITNNQTNTDSYLSEGGLKITRHAAYGLKVLPDSGFAKRRSIPCSRNKQKNVGKNWQKKIKPRSANLGLVGLSRPLNNKKSNKRVLSWMIRKAMLFISKAAKHLNHMRNMI